jgi:hypothetical protein
MAASCGFIIRTSNQRTLPVREGSPLDAMSRRSIPHSPLKNIETILGGIPFFYRWRKGRVEFHDDVLMKISLRVSGNGPCGQLSRLLAATLE